MTYSDVVATFALVLSFVALTAQGIGAFHRRKRLQVGAQITAASSARSDGSFWSSSTVRLTAHAIGGPIGIKDLYFELHPRPDVYGWSKAEMPFGWPPDSPVDLSISHRALEEGESVSWYYKVRDHNEGRDGVKEPRILTAVFILVTGKEVRTRPMLLTPDHDITDHEAMAQARATFAALHQDRLLTRSQRFKDAVRKFARRG
jgi:hypothetical protein